MYFHNSLTLGFVNFYSYLQSAKSYVPSPIVSLMRVFTKYAVDKRIFHSNPDHLVLLIYNCKENCYTVISPPIPIKYNGVTPKWYFMHATYILTSYTQQDTYRGPQSYLNQTHTKLQFIPTYNYINTEFQFLKIICYRF